MIIRKYRDEDRFSVRKICADTAKGAFAKKHKLRKAICFAYIDYYIDIEPQNVFVLEDNGVVGGYIVASFNPTLYQTKFRNYIKKIKKYSLSLFLFQLICLKCNKKLDKKYGCGFHINLDSKFQGKGYGTNLLTIMAYHALNNGANSLYLITRNNKTRGYGFYKHYGFCEAKKYPLGALLLTYNLNNLKFEYNFENISKKVQILS